MHFNDLWRWAEIGVSLMLVLTVFLLYNLGREELLLGFMTLALYTLNRITAIHDSTERRKSEEEVKKLLAAIANRGAT